MRPAIWCEHVDQAACRADDGNEDEEIEGQFGAFLVLVDGGKELINLHR